MSASTAGSVKEAVAIAYGQNAPYAAMFTADPGTGITPEVSGGTYARVALGTWNAGTAGDGIVTATATFNIPANVSTTHVGIVSAATGGTLLDKAPAVYNSQPSAGQVTVTFTYTQS